MFLARYMVAVVSLFKYMNGVYFNKILEDIHNVKP